MQSANTQNELRGSTTAAAAEDQFIPSYPLSYRRVRKIYPTLKCGTWHLWDPGRSLGLDQVNPPRTFLRISTERVLGYAGISNRQDLYYTLVCFQLNQESDLKSLFRPFYTD